MNIVKIADNIFRAYDIRGTYPDFIDESIAERMGMAWGTLLGGSKIVCVGFDTRTTTGRIVDSFINGVLSTGCSVINVGMTPNPLTYFYAWFHKLDAGVYITASHNPPNYTGFKFFNGDGFSYVDELEALKNFFVKGGFIKGRKGSVTMDDSVYNDYLGFWKERITLKRRVRIVADSFYASASLIAPRFFEEFGIECACLKNEIKGDFGGVKPEPTEETIADVSKKVVGMHADFGVGFDGDCDRSMFVDDNGVAWLGGTIIAVFSDSIVKKGDVVVASLDCPSEVSRVVESRGGRVVFSRVGHGYIEQNIHKFGAVFGGENSSHFTPAQYYIFSDGIASVLLMAKILSEGKESLSEIIRRIRVYPSEKLYINVKNHDVKDKAVKNIIVRLKEMYPDKKINASDGIKVFLNNVEWVLVRGSNTVPAVSLGFEARNAERAKELRDKFSKLIDDEVKKVS